MKKLSHQIIKIIRTSFKTESKKLLYRIISGWEQIIGSEFTYETIPIKLVKTKDGYILWIKTSSHSIASILHYQQNLIIEKIANFAAINNIKSIKVKISHEENEFQQQISEERKSYILPSYIKDSIEEIKDEEIYSALKKISEKFTPKIDN